MNGRVLVVEDDEDIVDNLRMVLEGAGYHVTAASDGREGLAALADSNPLPSVILLDLMMPVMTGYEFREAQLADPRIAAVPVVLMTADGNIAEKAKRLSVDAAIGKPFPIAKLLAAVQRYAGTPSRG